MTNLGEFFEPFAKVEELLTYMRAVETHPDLIYAEAESATGFEMRSATQVQHEAQFGIENSVKFKFLQELFNQLREQDMHIVLLLSEDNEALFNILRTFFVAGRFNYNMPTKGHQADTAHDALTITVFAKTASPIIQPASLVVCLDGVQSAAQVRQSNWAFSSGRVVPVLHLVIPQTVGHIERYIPSTLDRIDRVDEILPRLAQIQVDYEIGKPVDAELPDATEAAKQVAYWLLTGHENNRMEWPLPPVGNVEKLITYLGTQQPADYAASSPAPERTKRPLVS
jgi:hypothetical protein